MSILNRKIIYFIMVVEEGSFSAAAKKLFMSQANLSKQINALEKEIGVTLFDRSGYKPILTDAGNFLYEKIVPLRQAENEILSGLNKNGADKVTVSFTGVNENRELVDAVRAFQKKYPDINIDLVRKNFSDSKDALLQGSVDISFGLESIFKRNSSIQYKILHGYSVCFLCNAEHPYADREQVTVDQIKNEELVILSKKYNEDYYNDFMESCLEDGYIPNIKKTVNSLDELILSVVLGEGAALYGNDINEDGIRTIPIADTSHSPNYVMAYRKNLKSSAAENFVRFIDLYFEAL